MGASINDGINSDLTLLTYPMVDNAVALIVVAGHGALMVKLELTAAYRHVLVHPNDQALLAIKWGGQGIWTPPSLLVYAPPLKYFLHFIHYLDGFCSPPQSSSCGKSLQVCDKAVRGPGIPSGTGQGGPPCHDFDLTGDRARSWG